MLQVWIIAGVVLIALEIFLPGAILGFLGASALIIAGAIWWGLIDTWVAALTAWFIISLILMISLRGFFLRFIGGSSEQGSTDEEGDAYGTIVDVIETISPDRQGTIRYRDAPWEAICYGGTIEAGGKAMLAYRENLIWVVEAAGPDETTRS